MYGMKKSDGAEQPTTGHLRRAGLGRITLLEIVSFNTPEKKMAPCLLVTKSSPPSGGLRKIWVSLETVVFAVKRMDL